MKKYHYYCIIFLRERGEGYNLGEYFCRSSLPGITKSMIEEVRDQAKLSGEAVMVSCSYLGRMPDVDFETGSYYPQTPVDWLNLFKSWVLSIFRKTEKGTHA